MYIYVLLIYNINLFIYFDQSAGSYLVHRYSNHPVHLIDREGHLSPSAFIPFCDFGGNMSTVGVKIDQFDVPVCNSFQDKIINDQLCYEIDLDKFSHEKNVQNNLELGFAFIIAYNEDRQKLEENNSMMKVEDNTAKAGIIRKVIRSDETIETSIYFNTIGMIFNR